MNQHEVQAWLDRYVAAWVTYDATAIGELFSEDAAYRYHPADAPIVGRAAIVASWLELDPASPASTPDEPGTYAARYEPFAVENQRAVAVGWSRYWTDASRAVEQATYDNCFLLEFDAAGRCSAFTEFFRQRPA
jgi:hypothetical protein